MQSRDDSASTLSAAEVREALPCQTDRGPAPPPSIRLRWRWSARAAGLALRDWCPSALGIPLDGDPAIVVDLRFVARAATDSCDTLPNCGANSRDRESTLEAIATASLEDSKGIPLSLPPSLAAVRPRRCSLRSFASEHHHHFDLEDRSGPLVRLSLSLDAPSANFVWCRLLDELGVAGGTVTQVEIERPDFT